MDRHARLTRIERLRVWWAFLWSPFWLWWRSRQRQIQIGRARVILRDSGAIERARAVRSALRTHDFADRFHRAREAAEADRPLTDMASVRGLALGVLDQLGVDHRDVLVQFTWDPGARALSIFATESPAAAAAALALARGEASQGKRPSIAAGAHGEC